MRIYTIWRGGEWTELVGAWDDNSVDENGEGYEQDVKRLVAKYAPEPVRVLVVTFPSDALDKLFNVQHVQATAAQETP